MQETWKAIKGFEGFYKVSNLGRVKSVKRTLTQKNGSVRVFPERILKPYYSNSGYLRVRLSKLSKETQISVHRVVYEAYKGDIPKGYEIDHINNIKDDNRPCNLRLATRSQNASNIPSRKGSSSKYRGVTWNRFKNKWQSQICHKGNHYHIGLYDDEKEAAIAYNKKSIELKGEMCYINRIEKDENNQD